MYYKQQNNNYYYSLILFKGQLIKRNINGSMKKKKLTCYFGLQLKSNSQAADHHIHVTVLSLSFLSVFPTPVLGIQ